MYKCRLQEVLTTGNNTSIADFFVNTAARCHVMMKAILTFGIVATFTLH